MWTRFYLKLNAQLVVLGIRKSWLSKLQAALFISSLQCVCNLKKRRDVNGFEGRAPGHFHKPNRRMEKNGEDQQEMAKKCSLATTDLLTQITIIIASKIMLCLSFFLGIASNCFEHLAGAAGA